MKRQLLAMAACVLFAGTVNCQTEEEEVKQIRKWYAETEAKLTSCQKVTMNDWVDELEYSGYTPETVGYYDKTAKQFIKVTEEGGGDWNEVTHSFYLKDGVLFFVFSKGSYGNEMYTAEELGMSEEEFWQSGGSPKTMEAFEGRVYIANGKIIRYLFKKKVFPGNVNEFDLSDVKNDNGDLNDIKPEVLNTHIEKVLNVLDSKRLESQ